MGRVHHGPELPGLSKRKSGGRNLEYYAMDTYKPSPKATISYGMRVTWNTNVTSPHALFSRMAGSFLDASHATNQPLNEVVLGNVHNLFAATPLFVYQPRASLAYQIRPHIVVHTGSASSTTSSLRKSPTAA